MKGFQRMTKQNKNGSSDNSKSDKNLTLCNTCIKIIYSEVNLKVSPKTIFLTTLLKENEFIFKCFLYFQHVKSLFIYRT